MRRIFGIVLFATLLAPGVPGQQPCTPPTPLVLSKERNIFTEQQEVDIGDAVAEHIQKDFNVIGDEEINRYLNLLGQRLARHLPPSNLRFQYFLVDIPDVNASALPGGRVYVTRKLVAATQSEDELAGVLSHELGHLIARHNAVTLTRLFKEVLNVTQVKDREDIFAKYNQLVENAARKPKAVWGRC